jgi:hypothetical protein
MAAMDADPVNARWQEDMAPFFAEGSELVLLPEVFRLE